MPNEGYGKKVISNLIWRFLERAGAQIVQFIVSIVLARILEPDDYGTVALVVVIANILQVFVDNGMANALIQKKDADDIDFSSVFYINVIICVILYLLMCLFAPVIADFYNNEKLTAIIRVLCLTIVISGVKNVQQAYVTRTLQFKKFFFATIIGTVISAIVGIVMARSGCGVWSLVAQRLVNLGVDTVFLWCTVEWKPKRKFSISRVKTLYKFGWKLMVSSLLNNLYSNLRQMIIGKIYSEDNLAYYNQGQQYPATLGATISTSIDGVMFPVMSKVQEDKQRLKNMLRKSIVTSSFFLSPCMLGIFAISTNLVKIVLTDKWLPAVPFLKIFCVIYLFYPISTANLASINSQGKSNIFLMLEVVKSVIGITVLIISVRFGVIFIALGEMISSFACQAVNAYPNRKLLGYGFFSQLKDMMPNLFSALIMCVLVMLLSDVTSITVVNLLIQVAVGALFYTLTMYITKNETFFYILNIIKSKFK